MDKAEFVEKAPLYYAVAALIVSNARGGPITKAEIVDHFSVYNSDDPTDPYERIEPGSLLDAAISLLVEEKVFTLEVDDFAPELIIQENGIDDLLDIEWGGNFAKLWAKYQRAGSKREQWIRDALDKIIREKIRLGVTKEDFNRPDAEWKPIPIDRRQAEVQDVIKAVEEATEKLQGDNGYAANQPEERAYVLGGLNSFKAEIKESSTTSVPFIRAYAMEPIARGLKTLGKSASGILLEVLKAKIRAWLTTQMNWPFDWP
jgi:hypothetical protein